MRFIDAAELRRILPVADAVDALGSAFAATLPETPKRMRVEAPAGDVLLMPSVGEREAGVKLVTVAPANAARGLPLIHALYVLIDGATLAPVALFEGAALTALRTSAVSALATRHLARADASRLVIFGAGVQASAHLHAMSAVRPIERVTVVSRSAESTDRLVRHAGDAGLDASVGEPDAVAAADIVCTCTTSSTPVFDGARLAAGAHVNAVGAYRPEDRELDDETVRIGRLVVETREAAMAEAGDLLIPMKAGIIDETAVVADLAEVVRGAAVRRSGREQEDITVFKSVGVAFEDLVVARAAAERLDA